jgi:hypothetical protein
MEKYDIEDDNDWTMINDAQSSWVAGYENQAEKDPVNEADNADWTYVRLKSSDKITWRHDDILGDTPVFDYNGTLYHVDLEEYGMPTTAKEDGRSLHYLDSVEFRDAVQSGDYIMELDHESRTAYLSHVDDYEDIDSMEIVEGSIESVEKVIAYHGSSVPIRKFSPKFGAQGVMWFTEDRDKILRGESGASGRKYIMKVEITPGKVAGWPEYNMLMIAQLKNDGYNSVHLDDDWIVFDRKDVKVINTEKVQEGTVDPGMDGLIDVSGDWYHGSHNDFDQFSGRGGQRYQDQNKKYLTFLTRSRGFAASHGMSKDGTLYTVELDPSTKILDWSSLAPTWNGRPTRDDLTDLGKLLYDDIEGGKIFDDVEPFSDDVEEYMKAIVKGNWDAVESDGIQKWATDHGYDGFVVTGDGEKNIAVFDPARLVIIRKEKISDVTESVEQFTDDDVLEAVKGIGGGTTLGTITNYLNQFDDKPVRAALVRLTKQGKVFNHDNDGNLGVWGNTGAKARYWSTREQLTRLYGYGDEEFN